MITCRSADGAIKADHGVVCSFPSDTFGYFGWPTVARLEDGTLAIAASGMRNAHVCPFGKSVLCFSSDNGASWTSPSIINDSPADDRDTGIVSPGGDTLILSWFSIDSRFYYPPSEVEGWPDAEKKELLLSGLRKQSDAAMGRWCGKWIRVSRDRGETWGQPVEVGISSPHGPIVEADGSVFYFGKGNVDGADYPGMRYGPIQAARSRDEGATWHTLGNVPCITGTDESNYYEPHVAELAPGRLLGLIRFQNSPDSHKLQELGFTPFSIVQTVSLDGGISWTTPEPLEFHGSPPHVLKHSSGILVCTYGYRKQPYGQRIMLSEDDGASWTFDYILRDDGPDDDLGYPSSVELEDGSLITAYYQKINSADEKCSLLWSRWYLP